MTSSQNEPKSTENEVFPDLLECLVDISSRYNKPTSRVAATIGIPLIDGHLTPDLFIRAAGKLQLNAYHKQLELENLKEIGGPCVILLKKQKAAILLALHKKQAEIFIPSEDPEPKVISLATLKRRYVGEALIVQPRLMDETREKEEESTSKTWFWGTLSRFWTIYSQAIIASVLINIFTLAGAMFTLTVYDRVVPYNSFDTLWVLVTGILVIFGFDFLLRTLRSYFVDLAGKNADILLASMLFEKVMGIRMDNRPASPGTFVNQLREFETLREFLSSATLVALADIPFIFLFLFIVWIIGGMVVLAPLILIPLVIIVSFLIQGPISKSIKQGYRFAGHKNAMLIETIQGIETVKGLNAEGKLQNKWERLIDLASDLTTKTKFLNAIAFNFSYLAQNLTTVGIMILGVYQISQHHLTLGGLIACIILAGRSMAPVSQVVSLISRLNQSKEALESLNKIVDLPVERPHGKKFLHRSSIEGLIEFRNVDFTYPGQTEPTLKNFSMKINPGEKVALVGPIGSGKSTIEKLIMGFYKPQSGSILIDGIDINQLDPSDLRENIAYIPQDIFLFFGTLRDNIGMRGTTLDDASILKAAVLAGAHNFIRKHPQGYGVVVGEGGAGLSGGQKQTIAVARAMTTDPSIYLFDEPTAMMDQGTENYIVQQLNTVIGQKTLILVTHRSSLLSLVDRLIVIDSGQVLVDGPKDQVLQAISQGQIKRKEA